MYENMPTFIISIVSYLMIVQAFENPGSFFHAVHRGKRYITYPSGTAVGILVAIALPVEVPEENLYFSLNFEANYNLPDNITQYYNSDIARVLHSITRRSTYDLMENHLDGQGYNGEECLLLMICEMSRHDLTNNGLMSEILGVILRPSRTGNESLPEKYFEAERLGWENGNCFEEYTGCDTSILDFISLFQ